MAEEANASLIENGGFEKSIRHPDGFSGQYHPQSKITTDPAHVHSGKNAVHLRSDLYFSAKRIETKPGDRFHIRAWVKGKGRVEFLIFEYDAFNGIIQENILGSTPLTDDYAEVAFTYEPAGQVSEKIIRLVSNVLPCVRLRNQEEDGYIDDWSMVKIGAGKQTIEKRVIWPDDRAIAISRNESQRAELVARLDYDISRRWEIPKIKGRTFWWTLRHGWWAIKWLEDEPLIKYCLPQVGFDQRRYAALRELELFGPGGKENLARSAGANGIGKGDVMEAGGRLHNAGYSSGVGDIGKDWKNLNLLTDGQAPTETRFEWVKVKDAAYYGPGVIPIRAWAGVEFQEVKMVNRAVIHHGHNMNHTILGEYIAQADIADNFVLEYSLDGRNWAAIPGTQTENNREAITEHRFAPVKAKAIRVHIDGQAAPIPPVKGKAWKNIHWSLREYAARSSQPSPEMSDEKLRSKNRPFIGMEPYRRLSYAISGPDRDRLLRYFEPVMTDFEQYYGDAFFGFLLWEWDNDLFKAFQGIPDYDNPKSWKTRYEFMMKGLKSANKIYHGHTIFQGAFHPYGHYVFEAGAKAILDEQKGGYMTGLFQLQTTFLRSAARQYGRLWGTYPTPRLGLIRQKNPAKSEFSPALNRGGGGYDFKTGGWFVGPFQGVSPQWWKRMLYGNYFAGENLQDMELGAGAMVYNSNSEVRRAEDWTDGVNSGYMIPQGIVTRDMARFVEKHGERGVLYTPIGFVMDYWSGWTPQYASWPGQPHRWGDDEIRELMLTFFPVTGRNPLGFGYEVANKDMADTPFGECCDVLKPNPPSGVIAQDLLDAYKILWVAGSWREIPDELVERMRAYVRAGGTLVVNAAHVRNSPFVGENRGMALESAFLGVEFGREEKTSTEALFLLDDETRKPLTCDAFRYAAVRPTSARVVAKTVDGDPLVTLNKVSKGHVILTTTWYNLTDQKQRIVPTAERLLAYLTHQAMPVKVKGRIRYLVTRRKDGWVVVLLNNKGIFKTSQANAEVDHLQRVTVDLTLRAPALHVSEWTQDYTTWPFKVKDGKTHCGITVPPGDARVLFLKTR